MLDRLAALDRRVMGTNRNPKRLYDVPVPWWLKYAFLLGPLMLPLTMIVGPPSRHPIRVLIAFLVVAGGWVAAATIWASRHRIRSGH